MLSIYIVSEKPFSDSTYYVPIAAYERYQDACCYVNNKFGNSSEARARHIHQVPYVTDSNRKVDMTNLQDVIHLAIKASFEAYDYAQGEKRRG